ncbi:hypothetical protein Bca52824_053673 [Brassica carinata]|uniref:DUF4283 domain-containing protein n=1 Tax=Brassica carinata TaxID=52824 RepID=A0A8X7R9D7_BRACI|nr:hypothetical protein Bca52824_053673 [Brassica carinata]
MATIIGDEEGDSRDDTQPPRDDTQPPRDDTQPPRDDTQPPLSRPPPPTRSVNGETSETPPSPQGVARSPCSQGPIAEPPILPEATDGVVVMTIPDEILSDPNPLWRCYVVGYFIGDVPHVGSIHATVNRLWTSPKIGSKIDVQFLVKNNVLFRIENQQMRSRVIQRRYWHIADVPLVVNEWSPETALQPPDLSAMPLWIDLKGVPSMLFSHKALKCMSRAAGRFVKLHPTMEKCTRLDVARVLVEVDLNKPLVEKFCFPGKDGVQVQIEVCYPWLPSRCILCKGWGHKGVNCSSKKIKVLQKGKEIVVATPETDVELTGEARVRHATHHNHNVVSDMINELENLPQALGIGDLGDALKERSESEGSGSGSSEDQSKLDWALVGRLSSSPTDRETRKRVLAGHFLCSTGSGNRGAVYLFVSVCP